MIKISIIIPVYNCELYLEQCIRSALHQTLRDVEVICIDDGSTDMSVCVIKQLQEEDARVILFQQENQGAGAARNLGIRKARGKYIAFLDADDYYWDLDALKLMFWTCEMKKVNICSSLRKTLENGKEESTYLFQDTVKNEILYYKDFQLDYEYQSFLFLRRHLIENDIFFPLYLRFQDPPFLVKALHKAQKFAVADTYLYCYRVPDVGSRFDVHKVKDLLFGLIDNLIFARENNLEILFRNTVYRLEYEYGIIICRNVNLNDTDVLMLLLRANQIICEQYKQEDYIIRPLQILIFCSNPYERKLQKIIKESDEIVLYGAGRYGQIFLDYLRQHGFLYKVKSFVVSYLKEKGIYVGKIPVYQLDNEKAFIFVTAGEKNQEEIKQFLDKKGYKDYEIVKTEFLDLCGNG